MLTEEERLEKIYKRAKEIRKKEQCRRQWIMDIGCIAACMLLILGIGMFMPQVTERADYAKLGGLSLGAASIFGNSSFGGYVVMGILCFLLGAFATILMYRIHNRNKEDDRNEF